MNSRITIRPMNENDPDHFAREECAQGWHATPDKLQMRLRHEQEGKCLTFTAEIDGIPAGYVSLYLHPRTGAFADQGIPEIVDFAVLEKYRRRGVGTALMDAAEKEAAKRSGCVYLGVGLHSGYGSAQRMYVRRGYIPDGSGVWYGEQVCEPYSSCMNDDDLVLYMSKQLSKETK